MSPFLDEAPLTWMRLVHLLRLVFPASGWSYHGSHGLQCFSQTCPLEAWFLGPSQQSSQAMWLWQWAVWHACGVACFLLRPAVVHFFCGLASLGDKSGLTVCLAGCLQGPWWSARHHSFDSSVGSAPAWRHHGSSTERIQLGEPQPPVVMSAGQTASACVRARRGGRVCVCMCGTQDHALIFNRQWTSVVGDNKQDSTGTGRERSLCWGREGCVSGLQCTPGPELCKSYRKRLALKNS